MTGRHRALCIEKFAVSFRKCQKQLGALRNTEEQRLCDLHALGRAIHEVLICFQELETGRLYGSCDDLSLQV